MNLSSFFFSLAVCRMRSSPWVTLARLSVRCVSCWLAFLLVPALRSTGSAADCSALFAGFLSYYGRVRLPAFVHHRLRLLAFPMRTAGFACRRPNAGPPRFRRDPSVRDVAFDPGRAAMPRIAASLMLRSTFGRGLRPCGMPISWLNPTPRTAAVYASRPTLPSGSRNTRFQAARYALPGLDARFRGMSGRIYTFTSSLGVRASFLIPLAATMVRFSAKASWFFSMSSRSY